MKAKLYHTSGTLFKPGDIIGGPGFCVCMTTSPIPHYTIAAIVDAGSTSWVEYRKLRDAEFVKFLIAYDKWELDKIGQEPKWKDENIKSPKQVKLNVYEVKPFSKPMWNGINDEYRLYDDFVEIVRVVGNAKGILHNHFKKFGKCTSKAFHFGGKSLRLNKHK